MIPKNSILNIYSFTSLVFLITLLASFCQARENFTKPFLVRTIYGNNIEVINLYFDEDISGNRIAIYKTTDGEKGFFKPEDIENRKELDEFIAHDGATPTSQVDQTREFIPSIPPSGRIYIPAGMLHYYIELVDGRDFYLTRKNKNWDDRPRDIEELCKDFLFFRSKIIEYAKKGNEKKADKYRRNFQKTNQWLNEYHEDDIQTMFDHLNRSN